MISVSALLGELISHYVRMQRIAGETLDELLMSVAGLTDCRTVAEATDLGLPVVARLLGADMAFILLPLEDGSTHYLYGGGAGVGIGATKSQPRAGSARRRRRPQRHRARLSQRRIVFVLTPAARTWSSRSGWTRTTSRPRSTCRYWAG